MSNRTHKPLSLSVPDDLREMIDSQAKARGMTRNSLLNHIIRTALETPLAERVRLLEVQVATMAKAHRILTD